MRKGHAVTISFFQNCATGDDAIFCIDAWALRGAGRSLSSDLLFSVLDFWFLKENTKLVYYFDDPPQTRTAEASLASRDCDDSR